jgi:hypothetical protein
MDKTEWDDIMDKNLPLQIGTRIKKTIYGPIGDREYKGTIAGKNCLLGDFMYLVEYDETIPGGFGKEGENAWTKRHTGLNKLSWEYHPLEMAEEMIISREKIRGKSLDDDCKEAQISRNEYGLQDHRCFCYGLIDCSTESYLKKCVECHAFTDNAKPQQMEG